MEFLSGISKSSYKVHWWTKENHTGTKGIALTKFIAHITDEFQRILISTEYKWRYDHLDLV